MATINSDSVYTKTAKGLLEAANSRSVKLTPELAPILLSIDGRSTVADLHSRSGMTLAQFNHALNTLVTDGYIRLRVGGGQQQGPADAGGGVDFTQKQAIATVNAEAASRALAAADATKRAQAEARAARDAQLRQEAEARARALAETRAAEEGEARASAEKTARAAADERGLAELEARSASDPAHRTEAEGRARAAAAAEKRAAAEVRSRADAEDRARADIEAKRAAEEAAGSEAGAHAKAAEQAQARAAAEARARDALEAQVRAMESVRDAGDPASPEAEEARARLRRLENEAERARDAARAIAEAEGRADDVPQPEMDIHERVRQLNARVAAERSAREAAAKLDVPVVEFQSSLGPRTPASGQLSPLQFDLAETAPAPRIGSMVSVPSAETAAPPPLDLPMVSIPSDDEPHVARDRVNALDPAPAESMDLPVVDLSRTDAVPPPPSEHAPSALERVMAELAARAEAKKSGVEPAPAAEPEPEPAPAPEEPAEPAARDEAEKTEPTIDIDINEPITERVNLDRTSHDIIAESVEARRKTEAAQVSKVALEVRRRRAEEEAKRAATAERQRSRVQKLVGLGVAAVALPVIGITWLQFTTLNGYIPSAQTALSKRFDQPVAIENLRYVLLPSPRVILEELWIGKGQGVKVKRVTATVNPFSALLGPSSFGTVKAEDIEIDPAVLGAIPKWTGGQAADAMRVDELRLSGLKVNLPGGGLGTYDGNVVFDSKGTVKEAVFNGDKVRLALTPSPEGTRVALDATGWRLPYGPPLDFDRLKLSGLIDQGQIAAAEFTGILAAGKLEGALTARWAGPIAIQGEFKLETARLRDLTDALTPNFSARGTLKTSGRFSLQGTNWSTVRANPQVEAKFSVDRGELTGIDLVRAIQSAAPGAIRGGRTSFEELTGVMQIAGERIAFRQLQLTSGKLNASGTVDVGAEEQLSGRFSAQLASGGGVVARSSLGVGGTVASPSLTR